MIDKVALAYRCLMDSHCDGDRIFLFGFSRGAYTARVLAALLHMYGLLAPGHANLLPYVLRQFGAARGQLGRGGDEAVAWWALCDEFRRSFARPVADSVERRMAVHFLGAWDTVSSVGWVWDPATYPHTASYPSIRRVRHAVAIDERRAFFRTNRFQRADDQDLLELWFAGVHADIGGGYPEAQGGLWRVAFEWMLQEAEDAGLRVDPAALARVRTRTPPPARLWAEPQHESLTWAWWPAEFFPKLRWDARTRRRGPHLGLKGRRREMGPGCRLHPSVQSRLDEAVPAYLPANPGFDSARRA